MDEEAEHFSFAEHAAWLELIRADVVQKCHDQNIPVESGSISVEMPIESFGLSIAAFQFALKEWDQFWIFVQDFHKQTKDKTDADNPDTNQRSENS